MKHGMDIEKLHQELYNQRPAKRDFNLNQASLHVDLMKEQIAETTPTPVSASESANGTSLDKLLASVDLTGTRERIEQEENDRPLVPHLTLDSIGSFPISELAHRQIASHLKINKAYYDRMLHGRPEATPEQREASKAQRHSLLADNINTWLDLRKTDQRMVRTLNGRVRAYLSNAYRRIDNYDMFLAVFNALKELYKQDGMKFQVASCDVTDSYLYIKITTPRLQGEVKVGDTVQAGLVIKNSEVGLSSVVVEPMIIRLSCMNGAVMATAIRKRHVGSRSQLGDKDVEELFTDATKKLDDQAFFAKVQDVVKGSLTEDLFQMNLDKLKGTATREMTSDAKPVIEELGKRMSFSELEVEGVLQSYIKTIENTGATQWGLGNAVTLMSHGVKSYDRASELEKAGGQVFNLDDAGWADLMATAS